MLFTSKTMCLILLLTFCYIFMSSMSPTRISGAAKDTPVAGDHLLDGQTLVSSGQRFEFGFFTPGSSSHRYLGIWYKNLPLTVVWVANRNAPTTYLNGRLELDSASKLSLYNLTDIIWSICPNKRATNPVLQILDSGNLVLRDDKIGDDSGRYLWESFDYPCNTLLPQMKLGWNLKTGLSLNMTSWKSTADPSTGEFTLSLEHSSLLSWSYKMDGRRNTDGVHGMVSCLVASRIQKCTQFSKQFSLQILKRFRIHSK